MSQRPEANHPLSVLPAGRVLTIVVTAAGKTKKAGFPLIRGEKTEKGVKL
jgi:hypothetical protein